MARDFNGSNQYLSRTSAVVSTFPMTLACWFNMDTATKYEPLMTISNSASLDSFIILYARGDIAGDPVYVITVGNGGSSGGALTTTGFTAGTWHHACGVFASLSSRSVYIDGGSKATNTTTINAFSGLNRTIIGGLDYSGTDEYADGKIAEAAIWNVALTDAEVAILGKGYSPLLVRPASLVAYWPIIGRTSPEIDLVGGYNLTLTNAPTVADHPRVLRPVTSWVVSLPVTPTPPSGGTIPVLLGAGLFGGLQSISGGL